MIAPRAFGRAASAGPWRAFAVALLLAPVLLAGVAHARVPGPNRLETAIAETNVASGRRQALKLELDVQIGERTHVATAELISHPTGLARIELKGAGDLIERHIMQGSEVSASRNGRLLEVHRAFLPPFFILQADTMETLQAALQSFGVLIDEVGLSECGERDCLLIGDPEQAVHPRPAPPLPGTEIYGDVQQTDQPLQQENLREPGGGDVRVIGGGYRDGGGVEMQPEVRHHARLWVDSESYEVRGFETRAGVNFEFGPIAEFDKLRVPAWILIEEPGKAPVRFDVIRAARVTAPASEFTRDWLLAPVIGSPTDPNAAVEPQFEHDREAQAAEVE